MKDQLKKTSEDLLQLAMEKGAVEAVVVGSHEITAKVGFEKNDFNISTYGMETSYGLEVHKDNRKGSASTNETSTESLKQTVDSAVTLADFSLEDPFLCVAEPQEIKELPGRFDPKLTDLPADVQCKLAHSFIEKAKQDERISIDSGAIEIGISYRTVVNSSGVNVQDQYTQLNWRLMGMGKTPQEVTSFDGLGEVSFQWDGSEEKALTMAREFREKVVRCFGARKGESYKGKVIFSPAAINHILLMPLEYHISGRQIMDGKSRLAEELGKAIASAKFSLFDDPFDLELGGATPFDAEGVPVNKMPIVEKGVLKTHIDSCYTAKRRKTHSTGHSGGLHGLHIAAGGLSLEEMIQEAGTVVVVERFSGNADPVSGDISGVAKCSHFYKDGQYQYPLTETMVAGNFFEMLKNIVALSDYAKPFCSAICSPYIMIDGVSVSAG